MIPKSQMFSCVLCDQKYSLRDVIEGRYFLSTGVCYFCYQKGSELPLKVWCFGKQDSKHGYRADAIECSKICPDRILCKIWALDTNLIQIQHREDTMAKEEKKKGRKIEDEEEDDYTEDEDEVTDEEEDEEEEEEEEEEEDDGDDESDEEESEEEEEEEDEEPKKKKKSKKAKKTKKSKKSRKSKKARKVKDEDEEEEVEDEDEEKPRKGKKMKAEKIDGSPFRASGIFGQIMRLAQKGTTLKDVERFIKKQGGDPKTQLRKLRRGNSGGGKITWELEEGKGGRIKVTDVKVRKGKVKEEPTKKGKKEKKSKMASKDKGKKDKKVKKVKKTTKPAKKAKALKKAA